MTDVRSGFYEHNFMTRIDILQIKVARTCQQAFLTIELARLGRRAAKSAYNLRRAFTESEYADGGLCGSLAH